MGEIIKLESKLILPTKKGDRDMNDEVLIFSMKVARDLMQNNFIAIDIRPNRKYKGASIVVFEKTQEIEEYLLNKHSIAIQ